MITISGKWFDGRTSAQIDAVLKLFDSGACQLEDAASGDILLKQSKFTPTVSHRLANTPRYLSFPDGGTFETIDNARVDAVMERLKKRHWLAYVHRFESRLRYIIPSVILFVLLAAGVAKYGIPAAAKLISAQLPAAVYQQAGDQALSVLDKLVFKPSELSPQEAQRVRNYLQSIIEHHPDLQIAVRFRKGGRIGPNAFALPDGQIIFTDEMIELAQHDNEIVGVMAHEIGHVVYQHGMRRMVQDSLLSFAILAVTGDASGVSELFLGLPALLTEMAYSREFEQEADGYALTYLQSHSIALHHFADILIRISNIDPSETRQDGNKWSSYIASHPPTQERVKAFTGR
jgi:Zn-dependent protease with chaperone function